ncbi:MAG TPA: hypothetical protein VGO68_19915 [Pyrinomonadaceae bacterium]|jgi:hypothetical protein|nr:hypothetical protein [Pyrinomonadaceae bacterium]
MKKLQHLCMAGAFTLVLTTSTLAGDIGIPGFTQPPPPAELSATTPGDIETEWGVQNWQARSDSVTGISLNLLQTMLAPF